MPLNTLGVLNSQRTDLGRFTNHVKKCEVPAGSPYLVVIPTGCEVLEGWLVPNKPTASLPPPSLSAR